MGGRVLKGYGCLSDQVSYRLTMFTGKDVAPLSGTEHDMVPDRKVNQVRMEAQLLHRVGAEPFILRGHMRRVFAAWFHGSCFRRVRLHDRQRWLKSRTTKGLLLTLTISHQIAQHLFRTLDVGAAWTGFDHSRAIVFVTGLTQSGNAHRYSFPDCSGKSYISVYSQEAVLMVLVLESRGTAGYANSSNRALASRRSDVSKPSVNQWYTGPRR